LLDGSEARGGLSRLIVTCALDAGLPSCGTPKSASVMKLKISLGIRASLGMVLLVIGSLAGNWGTQAASTIPAYTAGTATTIQVPRWQPCDLVFTNSAPTPNPFALPFSAMVSGPSNASFKTLGFYDGGGTWRFRVTPNVEGEWSLVTESEAPALRGRKVQFTCVSNSSPQVHGGVMVDPKHPQHFVFEDGTRYFLMGYECDWLWALDLGKPDLSATEAFLDKLAANGFNYVILNTYAQDTTWRKGRTAADDFGPPPLYAWEGTNEQPDHSRFNLAYWQHYDAVIDALNRRGMVAHVMIKVYNKMVNWPAKGSAEEDLFFRWLAERYAAFPNVHWDFSKEAHNEKDLDYKLQRIAFLKQNDPYHRPITIHDDRATYDRGAYKGVLDYRSDQQHSTWHSTLLQHRSQRAWPVVNVEFGYEHGPGGLTDKTYNVVQAPEEVCRRAWEIQMAGGYGAYYYTYTAWDIIRPQDNPPGYIYFKHLSDFFAGIGYWRMEPNDELVSTGYCLADPGQEYVVFLSNAGPFTLKLEGLKAPLNAEWYQPLTGKRLPGGTLAKGSAQLTPPAEWGTGPVALHVGSRPME
jgi:hypothetical protein